jgi:hypothetical protein
MTKMAKENSIIVLSTFGQEALADNTAGAFSLNQLS